MELVKLLSKYRATANIPIIDKDIAIVAVQQIADDRRRGKLLIDFKGDPLPGLPDPSRVKRLPRVDQNETNVGQVNANQ